MAKVYIDAFASCDLPIDDCEYVYLCLDASWKTKVKSGIPLVPGKVLSRTKFQEKYVKKNACGGVSKSCKDVCRYQVEVDADLFEVNDQFIPQIPCSDDIQEILTYCGINHILAELQESTADSSQMTVNYDNATLTFTPADGGDPLVVDICALIASCLEAGQVPNSKTDTDSVVVTLTGALNRNIEADVRIAPGGNALSATPSGLFVDPAPPPALIPGCGISLSGADIAAKTSGAWGSSPLVYPACSATAGAPVYCDPNGDLRVAPPHGTIAFSGGYGTGIPALTPIVTVGTNIVDSTQFKGIDNNSCRTMEVLYHLNFVMQVVFAQDGVWRYVGEVAIDGGPFTTFVVTEWGTFPGLMGLPLFMIGSGRFTIAPGASVVLGFRQRIEVLQTSLAGSYIKNASMGLNYMGSTRDINVVG